MRKPGTLGSKKFWVQNICMYFLAELDHCKCSSPLLHIMSSKSAKQIPTCCKGSFFGCYSSPLFIRPPIKSAICALQFSTDLSSNGVWWSPNWFLNVDTHWTGNFQTKAKKDFKSFPIAKLYNFCNNFFVKNVEAHWPEFLSGKLGASDFNGKSFHEFNERQYVPPAAINSPVNQR